MRKTNSVLSPLISVLVCLALSNPLSAGPLSVAGEFSSLTDLLVPSGGTSRYVALTGFDASYEESINHAGKEYFNAHPELIERIRNDLDSRDVTWRLGEVSHRLMFVPETRQDVAGLFTAYCRESIRDLLSRTGLSSPYSSILALDDTLPEVGADLGIHVYIVHDLAKEYTARYQFSGPEDKRVEVDLAGRIKVNETGSYSSYLQYSDETRKWTFVRSPYTVWKCASANPYTVLMTPLEETLHILLREFTEKAIVQTIHQAGGDLSLNEVRDLTENWLAVEEAVVGGLVYKLIPEVVISRVPDLPREWIKADLEVKSRFHKYRFLAKGIGLVESHGLKEIIDLYEQNPMALRALLTEEGENEANQATPAFLPTTG